MIVKAGLDDRDFDDAEELVQQQQQPPITSDDDNLVLLRFAPNDTVLNDVFVETEPPLESKAFVVC